MTAYVASSHTLTDIANAIRYHNGTSDHYAPSEMADAVAALSGTSETCGLQEGYKEIDAGTMTQVHYTSIANAIRGQNGSWDEYKPSQMADAIRALTWGLQGEAYAVAIPTTSESSKYELHFNRANTVPSAGDTYAGKTIAYVYTGFEDTAYTSNSQVPWYPQHDSFLAVSFDDEIEPVSCAYWFYMFKNCTSFSVSNLNTSKAKSFTFMFYYCTSVTSLNLSTFVTSNVTSINYMFYFCTKLATLTMGAWDMTNLQVVAQAFRNLTAMKVLDLSGWTMPEYTSTMQYAFYNCSNLTTIYAPTGCDMSDTAVNSYCFSQCSKLKGGNGTAYSSSNVTAAMARIDGLGGQSGYFTAK